jgi:hypothetical protein
MVFKLFGTVPGTSPSTGIPVPFYYESKFHLDTGSTGVPVLQAIFNQELWTTW